MILWCYSMWGVHGLVGIVFRGGNDDDDDDDGICLVVGWC